MLSTFLLWQGFFFCGEYLATERKSWETGHWEFVGSPGGNPEGLTCTEHVAEGTCEKFGGTRVGVTRQMTSCRWLDMGGAPDREWWRRWYRWNVWITALDCSGVTCGCGCTRGVLGNLQCLSYPTADYTNPWHRLCQAFFGYANFFSALPSMLLIGWVFFFCSAKNVSAMLSVFLPRQIFCFAERFLFFCSLPSIFCLCWTFFGSAKPLSSMPCNTWQSRKIHGRGEKILVIEEKFYMLRRAAKGCWNILHRAQTMLS